jgi:hypothetical protein
MNEILEYVYKNERILNYCTILTTDYNELRSELIIQLLDMDKDKLKTAYDNNYLEYVCLTICKRMIYGGVKGSGIFYKKMIDKLTSLQDISIKDIECVKNEAYEKSQYFKDIKKQKILNILDKTHWYDKTLFTYYYMDCISVKDISIMTGISEKSIYYSISKTKKNIKNKLKI